MADYTDDLGLAHVLADTADAISTARFRANDLHVDTKPDTSHVTDADLAVEKAIRATLGRYRSRDSIIGEEFGSEGHSGRRWVIDPIDGTANYVRGVPVWATLIALMEGDETVVGLVSAPALGRRWWAAKGVGAYAGKDRSRAERLGVSAVAKVEDASVSISSVTSWFEHGMGENMVGLMTDAWRDRAYGDFYSYVLLAEGVVDIAAEPEVNLWDLAPLSVIIEEAGGRFTALDGTPGPSHGSAVATNGLLHGAVLKRLTAQE
ncbi:histidinol-phosphatase [Actinorhabdospora filicis]|uniref:Histidinol-phosphatase n=1 Tax=Actinorhabdospora filicis TaxID=1785913 RepID=A0A9W6SFD0_9ACTN|nr:inositol monophosphatase family protein [Actinorhabdospora filicis]GLZ76135.1 histidinol-phosphatase [Actinorhabdospora filicis]